MPSKNLNAAETLLSFAVRSIQIGGALSLWIGFLLRFFGPSSPPDAPNFLRHLAYELMGTGAFLLVVGTIARKVLLK
ncbi:MAG TPA: hypothetical protein VK716_14405 [Terracidiphilus sp.]|jgi:hypothetical protein|nr:hypothetical protein [Terracidiphilus sp.]